MGHSSDKKRNGPFVMHICNHPVIRVPYSSERLLPVLRSKVGEWSGKAAQTMDNPDPDAPVLYYTPLRIKTERAISAIKERTR
jgi:hypothetical protein